MTGTMSVATLLWVVGIGVVLPLVTDLATKLQASPRVKALVTALLAGITGAVAGFTVTPPHGVAQWQQVVGAVSQAWGTALIAFFGIWKPTGVSATVRSIAPHRGAGALPLPTPLTPSTTPPAAAVG